MHVPKAFIVLNEGYKLTSSLEKELKELCKKQLAVFSVPKEFEVRSELPKTLYNKVLIELAAPAYFFSTLTKEIPFAEGMMALPQKK